jgi:hypothetical protein
LIKWKKNEYEGIFVRLLKNNKNSKEYIDKVEFFIELHQRMIEKMKTNINLVDPIVTLRNLKYCCYLNNNSIPPIIAAEISYTARFPQNEKEEFQEILKKFVNIK